MILFRDKKLSKRTGNQNKLFYLQIALKGGHLGFSYQREDYSWMETRGAYFMKEVMLIS